MRTRGPLFHTRAHRQSAFGSRITPYHSKVWTSDHLTGFCNRTAPVVGVAEGWYVGSVGGKHYAWKKLWVGCPPESIWRT
jgi:hypothetical protein